MLQLVLLPLDPIYLYPGFRHLSTSYNLQCCRHCRRCLLNPTPRRTARRLLLLMLVYLSFEMRTPGEQQLPTE